MKTARNPKLRRLLSMAILALYATGCDSGHSSPHASVIHPIAAAAGVSRDTRLETKRDLPVTSNSLGREKKAVSATILARPQIPILCYHQIRDYKPTDSRSAKDYIVPPADFRLQMKTLADSGYKTILPAQLYAYLTRGEDLPEKAVLISFDDGCDEQFEIAHSVLQPLSFKASFFIMTVSLNRPNYLKAEQVRQLAMEGHSIGLHTWDHHNVKLYQGEDWIKQIEKPKLQLEKITGQPVQFFAYPFGLWNKPAIPELKSRGLVAAFQLSSARDTEDPLYSIRRIIVPGGWSGQQLINRMKGSFSH